MSVGSFVIAIIIVFFLLTWLIDRDVDGSNVVARAEDEKWLSRSVNWFRDKLNRFLEENPSAAGTTTPTP